MSVKTIKEKVEEYLELFSAIKLRTGGDERIALAILQEVNKDARMDRIREEKANGSNGAAVMEPATERQKEYLKKLGVEIRPGLTKKQASLLIDEEIAKESELDSSPNLEARVRQSVPLPWYTVKW